MAWVWSGARCHVGGEDVVRVAVEVLAGPVITHGGTRVGMAGSDLDIAQVHPCVAHVAPPVMTSWGDRNTRVQAPDGMQLTLFTAE